jgi:hypothetical protein
MLPSEVVTKPPVSLVKIASVGITPPPACLVPGIAVLVANWMLSVVS